MVNFATQIQYTAMHLPVRTEMQQDYSIQHRQ